MNKVAIFASGSGTNAQNLINFFSNNKNICIDCILSNRPDAFVIERAKKSGIDYLVFNREDFYQSKKVMDYLHSRQINYIVLAGFLWLLPEDLIKSYSGRIVNIHPALLPKYGGKGMYGMHVHNAVVAAREKETGITIHLVNEHYDEGKILFQAKCTVKPNDTAEQVANKIHELEYKHFPDVVEQYILNSEIRQ